MTFLDLDSSYKEGQWQRSPIKQDVNSDCQQNRKTSTFYSTVWAILLNKFTTSEGVSFVYQENKPPGEFTTIRDVSMEPQTSITDLLDHPAALTEIGQGHLPCNTGVVVDMQDVDIQPMPPLQVLLFANTTSSELWLLYSPDVASSHVENLVSLAEQIIQEILKCPNQSIKDLDLFSERNASQIAEWNNRIVLRDTIPLVDLVRQYALQQPTHEAVCGWNGSLTYAQLDKMTTQVALRLREMGIVQNDKILFAVEKSMYAVVAILSILKAGATFVPVSAAYPVERMQAIIDVTRPPLAICLPEDTKVFEDLQVRALGLDSSFTNNLSTDEGDNPLPASDLDRTAYILFTSGSTGRPKGCVHTNRTLGAMINQAPSFRIDRSSRVLQVAPIVFAAAIADTIIPLLVGATVCLASKYDMMNDMAASVKKFRATWTIMTPSAISTLDPTDLSGLQNMVVTGEPLSGALLKKHAFSKYRSLCYTKHMARRPNEHQSTFPSGCNGEMLIDGPNISLGYLDDPQKTAISFIDAPEWLPKMCPKSGRRVLRTGDLARYHADGSIIYVGRKDMQVKIRGKRIELGEIEGLIRLHLSLGDTVIVDAAAPLDGDGAPLLIAFISLSGNQMPDSPSPLGQPSSNFQEEASRLDLLVRAALPDFMVPNMYIPLTRIPKTASGKTNRQTLKLEVAGMTRQQVEAYHDVAVKPQLRPQTEVEISLHKLFSEVLKRGEDSFGIHDNFLRLGGDSIKAMILVQLCRKSGLSVDVAKILESGSVAQLAQMADCLPEPLAAQDERHVEVPTAAVTDQLIDLGVTIEEVEAMNPCSPMQDGILMSQLKNPQHYALRVLYEAQPSGMSSNVDIGRLQTAWRLLVDAHPILRTIFMTNVTSSVFAVQVQLKKSYVPQVEEMNEDSSPTDIFEQRKECQPPSMLPRLDLHVTPSGRIMMEFELSHAVVDGMSMSLIVRDLCNLYSDANPSLSVFNFVDHAKSQQGTSTEISLSYWKHYLDGVEPSQFPTAGTSSSNESDDVDQTPRFVAVSADVGSAADYRKLAQETGATVASFVKLSWSLMLHIMCRTDDVCFGYLTTSRDAPVDGILDGVGPLIDLLVFRQRLDPKSTVAQVLKSIQADFVSTLPHKGVSLSDIRQALNFGTDDVMFNTCVSHFPATTSNEAEDLPIHLHEVGRQDPTDFDLFLEIMESENEIKSTIKAYTSIIPLQTMERVATIFGHFMRTILTGSGRALGELALVPEKDLATIAQLNRSIANPAIESCVHDIILQQCQSQPTAPAVCAWDGEWTYGELDLVSSSLAHQLQSNGVVPDSFVPVLMDKSRWVPIALLAILKAGGAFVLLDPTQPIQRLQDICADLKANTIVLSPNYHDTVAPLVSNLVVAGNEHPPPVGDSEVGNPQGGNSPKQCGICGL
ncbi:unnamed protein product [Penicillium salamii]|uniref:Carrier domain-containing protein n=1 Tax=Penicillium salamii TaxID=1612424 RepID=A0A9W4IXN4_9EURO|nr:unnamed protein product [Penicillium salamii]CAG8401767.1 unnamed protein product [Penicillium salamii]CAG8402662.1 unnamed protein product [Penicillium salamii]